MDIRIVPLSDKKEFNVLAPHPLQSWEWGEFRQKTGVEIIRLGSYKNNRLIETAQFTLHPLPFTKWSVGYFPKGNIPSKEMLTHLLTIGKQHNCIFIKLEPNVQKNTKEKKDRSLNILISQYPHICLSPHPLFTSYSFYLDLTKSEEELFSSLYPKTRYNIRLAQKHKVTVQEETNNKAFDTYLDLTFETTKRQKFYAHDRKYHYFMWETLKSSGIAHLLTAQYLHDGKKYTLASWIVFLFHDVLYYPYGASNSQFRNVMASNLLMWEVILFGKRNGAKLFDMWGSLGPSPLPSDLWYGFHRFKEGYNPKLVEFIGSFDVVIHPALYQIYNTVYLLRQLFLEIKSRLKIMLLFKN